MNDKAELLNQLKIDREPEQEYDSGGRRWLPAMVTLVAVAAGTAWWLLRPLPAIAVETETAVAQPAQQSASVLDASGYVTARRMATVSAKVTGKVVEVLIEEGMRVEQDQVLARLDSASERADFELVAARLAAARAQLNEIEVSLNDARRSLRRTEELNTRELASEADLDQARARVDTLTARLAAGRQDVVVAERSLAVQQQRLDDTIIRAPFSGVVIAKAAQPGEMISPISAGGGFTRTGICTIVDMSSLEIEVDVNEAYIQRVRDDQNVTATLDAYPDWQIPARVIAIIPTADRQKATVRVRVGFEQLDDRILPDMGVKVSFHSGAESDTVEARPGVLVSPDAVRRDDGAEVVFVLIDDVVERRAIQTGGRLADRIVVLAGLRAGERVIRKIPPELNDGDVVTVQPST